MPKQPKQWVLWNRTLEMITTWEEHEPVFCPTREAARVEAREAREAFQDAVRAGHMADDDYADDIGVPIPIVTVGPETYYFPTLRRTMTLAELRRDAGRD